MSIDRRRFLQLAGASAAALALPACGDEDEPGPIERAVARRSIGIDYASYYAPVQDLRRLVLARARDRGAHVTFSHDESGAAAQRRTLERWTGPRGGFRAIVVAPFDRAAVEPIAAKAIDDDIAIVSYLVPLRSQTAAIAVDPATAGALLADAAARWAHGRSAQALLVRPPARPTVPDPFAALAPATEHALRGRLTEQAPDLQPVAVTEAQGEADAEAAVARALADYPDVTVALTWNDGTALGAAAALRKAGADPSTLFAGGVALPGIAGKENLDALEDTGGVEVTFVAPRLRALADLLVDVPLALLRNQPAGRREAVPIAIGTSTGDHTAFRADYGA